MSHKFVLNVVIRVFGVLVAVISISLGSTHPTALGQTIEPIPVAPQEPAPPGPGNPGSQIPTPPTPNRPEVTPPSSVGVSPTPTADRSVLSARIKSTLPMRTASKTFGSQIGATFSEIDGSVLHSMQGQKPFVPASTTKLFTAALALRALGPDTRLPTRVTLIGRDEAEPSRATISLVAGGDPLLSSANLRELAKKTHGSLAPLGVRSLDVIYDDSLFPPPSAAPGWRKSYNTSTIAPVRALVRDRRNLADTSKDAAVFFNKRLKAEGFETRLIGRQSNTSGAYEIAIYRGHTVSHAVRLMSVLSDNDIAENLFRHTAIARGYPANWAGASAAMAAEAQLMGIPTQGLQFVDGSGLSRSNRLTSDALVLLLQKAASGVDPSLGGLADGTYLATAGRSGTLSARYKNEKTSCSKGVIDAKTGSLRDVAALAGLATGIDGHRRAFAVLVNGPTVQAAPRKVSNAIDSLATTLVGCR